MAPVDPMTTEDFNQPEPKKVTVKAAEAHSAFGKDYQPGDEYEVDEATAATLEVQGKAHRVTEG